MVRVVFMCGPSGSGKTTYARGLEAAGMVRLSFDDAAVGARRDRRPATRIGPRRGG